MTAQKNWGNRKEEKNKTKATLQHKKFIHKLYTYFRQQFSILIMVQWVSSCLTAHQHKIGYLVILVPYYGTVYARQKKEDNNYS